MNDAVGYDSVPEMDMSMDIVPGKKYDFTLEYVRTSTSPNSTNISPRR
ncbi:MAG: hypothetical protein MJY45_07275 [Bacteroidales bacterium]|nr:hypothetical protein [Bacteroidales bacterium]